MYKWHKGSVGGAIGWAIAIHPTSDTDNLNLPLHFRWEQLYGPMLCLFIVNMPPSHVRSTFSFLSEVPSELYDLPLQFYAPRIGALYVRGPGISTPLHPMMFGGGQERNFRPG